MDSLKETKSRLQKYLNSYKPIYDIENHAKELMCDVPKGNIYIGICGVDLDFDSQEINECILIRKVTNAPGVIHVCSAGKINSDLFGAGRFSSSIKAELVIQNQGVNFKEYEHLFFDLVWHTAAMIKLRGYVSLFCPVSASSSWDIIGAILDNSVSFTMLDDVPKQLVYKDASNCVNKEDINWVKENWENALKLRGKDISKRFGLAFNLAYSWNQTIDYRIAIADLWCGLEALFGCQNDTKVTDKLAERISNWIPFVTKQEVRNLYKQRCDAVHGRFMNKKMINKAIKDSELILRSSIVKCVESFSVPLPDWNKPSVAKELLG